VHEVTLSSFYIAQTEVTQALWQAVMGDNPSHFTGDLLPVENVSWNDCQQFVAALNDLTGQKFRLPTEAEWEFAARGGNESEGFKYAGSNNLPTVGWYSYNDSWQLRGTGAYGTHPVATRNPNELMLYDMSGNVHEWCQDWFGNYSTGAQTNPTGPVSGTSRVYRGGSWYFDEWFCRVSFRNGVVPTYRSYGIGLRLALD
jgi:formylglycine-generating enzyme required for sulfatase activity